MLTAVAARFAPVYVEKDDEAALVERYGIEYYPTFVWTDATGEEVMRTGQPESADELLEDLATAVEFLDDPEADED